MNPTVCQHKRPLGYSLLYWWPQHDNFMPDMKHTVCLVEAAHSIQLCTSLADSLARQLPGTTADDTFLYPSAVPKQYWREPAKTQASIRLASHLVRVPPYLEDMSLNPLLGHKTCTLLILKTHGVQSFILVTPTWSFHVWHDAVWHITGKLTCLADSLAWRNSRWCFSTPKCNTKAVLEGALQKRSLPRLMLASGLLAIGSDRLTPNLEDVSLIPLRGHEPSTLMA